MKATENPFKPKLQLQRTPPGGRGKSSDASDGEENKDDERTITSSGERHASSVELLRKVLRSVEKGKRKTAGDSDCQPLNQSSSEGEIHHSPVVLSRTEKGCSEKDLGKTH